MMNKKIIILLLSNIVVVHKNFSESMLRDMAVMVAGQYAGSVANQMVTSEFDDLIKSLNKNQKNISTAINDFGQKVQQQQSQQLHTTFYLFQQASKTINQLLSNQQNDLNQMLNYIQASVSQNIAPIQNYLTDAAHCDHLFALGTMYTPRGLIWKNIYPVGNWEYDEQTDSFWQMSLVPMMQNNNQGVASADYAINNSIFAEWITKKATYEIECEFSMYQVSYPFFIGLIFNKARWISGDITCLQKYRLFGVYGVAVGNNSVCFAEAVQQELSTESKKVTWIFPMQQIIGQSQEHDLGIAVSNNFAQNTKLQPTIFRLKVLVSAGQMQFKFWQIPDTEPTAYITRQSENADLFLYHGVGFIAPGCVVQCKMLQPSELLFDSSSCAQFQAEVQAMVKDKLVQQNAKTIDILAAGVSS